MQTKEQTTPKMVPYGPFTKYRIEYDVHCWAGLDGGGFRCSWQEVEKMALIINKRRLAGEFSDGRPGPGYVRVFEKTPDSLRWELIWEV